MSFIRKEIKGYIGYLVLNHPEKLNALSESMMADLVTGLKEFDQEEKVRCIVLRGEGRAFSAGHDVDPADNHYSGMLGWHERAKVCNTVPYTIWNMSTPIIAQVHGYCLGGASAIASVCDLTIAAEGTKFGEPEIQHNSCSPFPMLPYVLGYKKAKEVMLLGEHITAQEAEKIGLINRCVPMDKLDEVVHEYAMKLVKMPVPAVHMSKRILNHAYEAAGFRTGIQMGEECFAQVLSSETPEFKKFCEIRDSQGLKKAFEWRNRFFEDADSDVL